jgi:hypothetical protein
VVPERYEINAGIIGRMQGEKNEPAPASADTRIFASTIKQQFAVFVFQFFSKLAPNYDIPCNVVY